MKKPVGPVQAVDRMPKSLAVAIRALDEKKAEDIKVFDVRAQSSITDYLILATVTSGPHLRALRSELEKALEGAKVAVVGVESGEGSGWTVLDAFEVMVHLFTAENRTKYRLELLWNDALEVPIGDLRAAPQLTAISRRPGLRRKSARQ